jgi:phosphatidate cytidylyltransferase
MAKISSGLASRVLSALVLAPIVLVSVAAGSPWFDLILTIAAGLMAREWGRMAESGAPKVSTAILAIIVMAGVLGITMNVEPYILLVAGVSSSLFLFFWAKRAGVAAPAWLALGAIAIGVPCMALDWLRADPVYGQLTIFWLFGVVWATDIGAYAAGRTIGGAKLAPRISPNKTWAGLAGGVLSAGLVGLGVAIWFVKDPHPLALAGLSAALAVLAQLGDLGESSLKRHFGVKDSGRLIPGHGGVLDRCDGLLSTAPAVALLCWFAGGTFFRWN